MNKVRRPVPYNVPFAAALRLGHLSRMESRAYMDWVKSLPCVVTGQPADDPHHIYNVGFGGMGTKVPDYWCIPLTRDEHDKLHADVKAWEAENGSQQYHALMTLTRAIYEEILR